MHSASLKSICVPVSGHKRQALHESSSLFVGGFYAFFPLSHCSLIPLYVPPLLFNKLSLAPYFVCSTVFLIFPFQADLYQHCSLPSAFCSIPPIPPFLSLLILSPGFPGCKWQTSRVVKPSKKSCCYHLEINPSMSQCLYGNSVGHKMLSSTGGT